MPNSPELAHPLKVSLAGDSLGCQLSGHIPSMHIYNNERTQSLTLQLAQLAPHLVDNLRMHMCFRRIR